VIGRHLQRLRARDEISTEEEHAIRAAVDRQIDYPAGKTIIRAGEELTHSTILLDGFMARYKDLRGGERQISELHVPGDFVDLHGFTLKRLDHGIATLTACRVATVPHERLEAITRDHPHLTRVYWFSTNLDASIHREWELSLGRRSAAARLAALFLEMRERLAVVEMADGPDYDLPFTQATLAECLGLTPVHVNRTLKELREQGLLTFTGHRVRILDRPGLVRLADFDPTYLYLERRAR
jgi:CRP-like cAMP-binding protein